MIEITTDLLLSMEPTDLWTRTKLSAALAVVHEDDPGHPIHTDLAMCREAMDNEEHFERAVKEGRAGVVTERGTPRKGNYGKPRSDYLAKLQGMSRGELAEETKQMIWLSAYAANNPRSDYHWQCDATYDEWIWRDGDAKNYSRAHKRVMEENGY